MDTPVAATNPSEPCEHLARCAGCALPALSEASARARKRERVERALGHYPELGAIAVEPVVAAEPAFSYRNRAKLVASPDGEIGLFSRGGHEVVDIPGCRVLHPRLLELVAAVRARVAGRASGLTALDARLVVYGDTQGVLLTLAGERAASAGLRELARALEGQPHLLGVALRVHDGAHVQQLSGLPERVWGCEFARDSLLGDGRYHYATYGSFVQAHRGQAAALSRVIIAQLQARLGGLRGKRVLELYAGAGGLGLALGDLGASVLLLERYGPALERALCAAAEQGVQGLLSRSGEVERVLPELVARGERFDALIVNPPRRGLPAEVRAQLPALGARALVYISCEPSTLARDLADLAQRGLAAQQLQPFDMIPQAADVECLAVLAPAPPAPLRILYEDDQLIAVDKPAHLPSVPQPEHGRSLLARLRSERGLPELRALHRLDIGTSGVCLFAKTAAAVPELARQLAAGSKQYLALVRGCVRDKGIVRRSLREQHKTREAVTRYRRVRRVAGHSLVRVRPEQGRTHQIRKHMAAIAHPILGDVRYGDPASNRFFEHRHGLTRPFLHALRIELPACGGRPPLQLEAALAPDLVAVLDSLDSSLALFRRPSLVQRSSALFGRLERGVTLPASPKKR